MRNLQAKWLLMALLDILIVSIALPLNFYVALLWDRDMPLFYLFMGIAVFLNAITYSLGWFVSWMIYKGVRGDGV